MTTNPYDDVRKERAAQDAQWGGSAHDDEHTPEEWFSFRQKFEERVLVRSEFHKVREELVKIAALTLAQIESLDREMMKERDDAIAWRDKLSVPPSVAVSGDSETAGGRKLQFPARYMAIEWLDAKVSEWASCLAEVRRGAVKSGDELYPDLPMMQKDALDAAYELALHDVPRASVPPAEPADSETAGGRVGAWHELDALRDKLWKANAITGPELMTLTNALDALREVKA